MLQASVELHETMPHRIVVDASYHVKDVIRAIPGARWDNKEKFWSVPTSWVSCLALRDEFGSGLTIGPKLNAWAKQEAARKLELSSLRGVINTDAELPDKPGFETLFGHQKVDALAIAKARRYLLLNETGTGKSRSALAGLSMIEDGGGDIFPLLIIAPKSMLVTWSREVAGFFPDAEVRVCQGTPAVVRDAIAPGGDVYVIGWDSLRRYSRLSGYGSIALKDEEKHDKELQLIKFKSAIVDEIHRGKSPESQRTRAAWAATGTCENVVGLTGTPVQDTPEDLWAILRLLFPHEYGTKTPFIERFVQIEWNHWGGRDVVGLREDKKDEFFKNFDAVHRRITKEMCLDLPEKIYQTRWVTLPPKFRKAYESMQENLVAELDSGGVVSAENVLTRTNRLIQLANAWGEESASGMYRMQLPSPKLEAFFEDIKEGDFDGQQVVVFSDSRQLIDLLADEMLKKKLTHTAITGSVTGEDRQAAIDVFQHGDVQFCLLTRAGGEGVTLTAASTMVRLIRPWSHTVHTQVEDRVHRIGSERHKQITYIDYVTDDTVECVQLVRLNSKEARAQEILRDADLLEIIRKTKSGEASAQLKGYPSV